MRFKAENRLPKARSGHRIVSTDSDVYSFGGYNPTIDLATDPDLSTDTEWLATKPLFRELWRFSYISREWTKVRTSGRPPNELASHCAQLIDDKYLLVFGGTGVPFGQTSSNKLFVCNLTNSVWNVINSNNVINNNSYVNELPVEQYGQALTVDHHSDRLYVCGGTTGFHYTIDVHMFDLKTRLWHKLYEKRNHFYGEFPEERYRHELVLYKHRLYVFGGGTSYLCHPLDKIPVFDIESREWTEMQTKNDLNLLNNGSDGWPQRRRCHDCIHIGQSVFLMGGTDGNAIFDDFWKLDLESMKWSRMWFQIPRSVYFHSASVSTTGRMSLFGGVTNPNHLERTNELFSIWLKIPDLKDMAFEAVLYYIHNNNRNKNKTNDKSINEILFELQIPLNYRLRLT